MATQFAPNQTYDYLSTVQASAADLSINNGIWYIGNPLVGKFEYPSLIRGKVYVQPAVAETLQVWTLTITAAANTEYSIQLSQYDKNTGLIINRTYSVTSLASGSTATTIGDSFRTAITADAGIHVAATGTTTLILTAEAGYANFQVATIGDGVIAIVDTTPGVPSKGTAADLALKGITVGGPVTQCHFEFYQNTGDANKSNANIHNIYDLYILEGASNASDLITAIERGLGNVTTGTTAQAENQAYINS